MANDSRFALDRGILSQRGEIARDGVAFALGQHLHEFRHVEVVGPLLGGKGAHCRGEVFITEPGQPRSQRSAYRPIPLKYSFAVAGLVVEKGLQWTIAPNHEK